MAGPGSRVPRRPASERRATHHRCEDRVGPGDPARGTGRRGGGHGDDSVYLAGPAVTPPMLSMRASESK